MIDKLGGLKIPPFHAVSGPSLCPGHLYRVDSRSDEHRAEFFAVTAVAAVTDLPAIAGTTLQAASSSLGMLIGSTTLSNPRCASSPRRGASPSPMPAA